MFFFSQFWQLVHAPSFDVFKSSFDTHTLSHEDIEIVPWFDLNKTMYSYFFHDIATNK